jgi:anaerobic glycerol-3-phosphate dehydrogenase
MQDYQTHLEKLRKDAAEFELISNLATDLQKRELFKKLAEHLATLATEVERAMAAKKAGE